MNDTPTAVHPRPLRRRRQHRGARRGIAIVVVLGLISITLALSYAMLSSQGTAVQIQQNSRRLVDARSAAMSGMTIALGRMHQADWQGIAVPLSGALGGGASYDVSFQVGDPQLKSSDADFGDWPYRVTLTSTGYAQDRAGSGGISMYRVRTTVRLNPSRLNSSPTVWPKVLPYTVYQWSGDQFTVQPPARIQGRVYMDARLLLCVDYPSDDDARNQYLYDLNRMRLGGRSDWRPFTGRIDWKNHQYSSVSYLVSTLLGVPTDSFITSNSHDFAVPPGFESYQLYAGGPNYAIPALGAALENTTLEADPKTNPLGLFYREGSLELRDNVTVRGTLVVTDDVTINGVNVRLSAAPMLGVTSSSSLSRFPALLAGDDIRLSGGFDARIEGAVFAADDFEVEDGAESDVLLIEGRLIAANVKIGGRLPWYYSKKNWSDLHGAYLWQLIFGFHQKVDYFPDFLLPFGRSSEPKIVIRPAAAEAPTDHWQKGAGPVYLPAAAGGGLTWDLIDWTDEPTP